MYKQSEKTKKGHMEADTRKPKKWMKIANELNCKFVTTHVLMLLFKNPARLPCLLCLAPIRFTLPCPICFALPLKNAIMTIAMSSYPSSPYFLSLHFLLSLSLSLSLHKFSNKAQNRTQLYQTLNATLQTKILLQKPAI